MRLVVKWGLLALMLVPILASAASAEELQILRRGNGAEPATLDPAKAEAVSDHHILNDLFEGLTILDKNGAPAPGAAESWTISPDGKTYVFKLRPNLKWSNGETLNAEDFVYSFRRAVDPATGSAYGFLYYPVTNAEAIVNGTNKDVSSLGVRALDPDTLEITLVSPTGYFLSLLSHEIFFPVYRKGVEQYGAAFTRPGNLVSNGAFLLKEWTPQSRLIAAKNPYFHGAASVKLDQVEFLPIENENEEFKRYRAGEIEITENAPVDQMAFIKSDYDKEFIAPPYFGLYYIGFNVTRPPFKDAEKLRTALSMVIDRDSIVNDIMRRGERAAYSWIPPGVPGYASQTFPWKDEPLAQRITEARKLYAEAGYGPDHPLQVELRYNTSENHKKVMIAVAAMWKQALGVDTSLVNEEWKVFLETRKGRKVTEAYRDAWIGDFDDPAAFFDLITSTSGLNYSGWSNPHYDALVAEAANTVDPQHRSEIFQQAEQLVLHDMPVAPVYSYVNPHLVKPYVIGYAPNILGYAYSKDISLAPGHGMAALSAGSTSPVWLIGFGVAAAVGLFYIVTRGPVTFIVKRLLGAIPTLFVIVTVSFFMIRLAPGGPFDSDRAVPPEIQANLNRVYHLDQPLLLQYTDYLENLLHGDFGPSFSYKDFTVTELIWQGFPVSMQLGLTAILLAAIIGSIMGTLAALRQNRATDYSVMTVAMTGITIPNFVMAPLLTLIFALYLHWLPMGGWGNGSEFIYKILPIVALALPQIAYVARLTRGSMIEVMRSNYIRTARAKGLSEWVTVTRHAARAALLPVVSYLGPASAGIVTGSVVIEKIFNLPGIGRYFVQGALNRDYTLVMGVVIFYGVLIILFNLIVDVLYGMLDPKLSQS